MSVPEQAVSTAFAKPVSRVSLGIKGLCAFVCARGVEDVAILGGHEEDQPIDETEKLLKKVVVAQPLFLAFRESCNQGCICRMLQESGAEFEQRRLNADTQVVAGRDAFFPANRPPVFQHALRRRSAGFAKARVVCQHPESAEVGIKVIAQDARQVDLYVAGSCDTFAIAHDAPERSVRGDSPQGGLSRIQVALD